MKKEDFFSISPCEAFEFGKKCKQEGYSIDYNPYRNVNTFTSKKINTLNNSWIEGWQSLNK